MKALTSLLGLIFVLPAEAKKQPDPVFQGKALSQWVREIRSDSGSQPFGNSNAVVAIRAIGTNAVPWLLEEMKAKDSQLADVVKVVSNRQTDSSRNYFATEAFKILGPQARQAVPDLTRILMSEGGYDYRRRQIIWILPYLGDAALPAFRTMLSSKSFSMREHAVMGIASRGEAATAIIPDLLKAMKDPSPNVQCAVAFGFSNIRTGAEQVVPALMEQYRSADRRYQERKQRLDVIDQRRLAEAQRRQKAAQAKARRGEKITFHTRMREDLPPEILAREYRIRAAYTLGSYGKEGAPALPMLEEELKQVRLRLAGQDPQARSNRLQEFEKILTQAIVKIQG